MDPVKGEFAYENLLERLRAAELRPTAARISILQTIEASALPLTAEQVYRHMLQRGTRVSVGTVYRAAQQFEAKGLLLREWDRQRKALYRIKPSDQDARLRLVCQDCGYSVACNDDELLASLQRLARSQGLLLADEAVAIPCACRHCEGTEAPTLRVCPLVQKKA